MLSADGSVEVGRINKQWRGCCAETFTDADSFGVTFPLDMEVRTKALVIGALFLIVSQATVYMYYPLYCNIRVKKTEEDKVSVIFPVECTVTITLTFT